MPIHKAKNEDFFKIWTSDMAYVLGFFSADGSMYSTKRGGYYINFEITDIDLLKAIKKTLGARNKISVRRRPAGWKTIYRLQMGSKCMFNDLIILGFTQSKSLTMELPSIPLLYLADFVRGYFDGDGCVHFGRYWRKDRKEWKLQLSIHFTSGSRKFLDELWVSLQETVRGGHIAKKARGYELVFGQHDAVALFHFMYDNGSELFLRRKYRKFRFAFKTLSLRS
jgi:intein-encoded DNA endonuclease-like protein